MWYECLRGKIDDSKNAAIEFLYNFYYYIGVKKISKDSMENAISPVVEGEKIVVQGAREHNLKNVSVEFPRNKLVVISGLSGSGKSSLAFDTLFAEWQRRYMETFPLMQGSFWAAWTSRMWILFPVFLLLFLLNRRLLTRTPAQRLEPLRRFTTTTACFLLALEGLIVPSAAGKSRSSRLTRL